MRIFQAIQITKLRDVTDSFVGADGSGAYGLVLRRQFIQIQIHPEPRTHRHTAREVHRPIAPMCDVAGDGHRREKI